MSEKLFCVIIVSYINQTSNISCNYSYVRYCQLICSIERSNGQLMGVRVVLRKQ